MGSPLSPVFPSTPPVTFLKSNLPGLCGGKKGGSALVGRGSLFGLCGADDDAAPPRSSLLGAPPLRGLPLPPLRGVPRREDCFVGIYWGSCLGKTMGGPLDPPWFSQTPPVTFFKSNLPAALRGARGPPDYSPDRPPSETSLRALPETTPTARNFSPPTKVGGVSAGTHQVSGARANVQEGRS